MAVPRQLSQMKLAPITDSSIRLMTEEIRKRSKCEETIELRRNTNNTTISRRADETTPDDLQAPGQRRDDCAVNR